MKRFVDYGLSSRRRSLRLIASGAVAALATLAARPLISEAAALPPMTIYKDPNCGCCGIWTSYLRARGFKVEVVTTEDMDPIKRKARVPYDLQTCHTAFMGDYVVEGHVPMPAIRKLLDERPKVLGIAVPGMPAGSPGMPTVNPEPYQVFTFAADGSQRVYMSF
jgi:hypothetical protein